MLVLGRAPGEEVVIRTPEGRVIRVQVVDGRDRTRLGFTADREVLINRAEMDGDPDRPRAA
jgi:sRNA-binding carbon storage regulator CsrA